MIGYCDLYVWKFCGLCFVDLLRWFIYFKVVNYGEDGEIDVIKVGVDCL